MYSITSNYKMMLISEHNHPDKATNFQADHTSIKNGVGSIGLETTYLGETEILWNELKT